MVFQQIQMKKLIIISLLLLNSCVSDSWIGRKINKATPERVLGYLQKHNKELFLVKIDSVKYDKKFNVPVTFNISGSQIDSVISAYKKSIVNGDTVVESNCDSIFKNFVLENNELRLSIKKANGKYNVLVNKKPQVIHDTVPFWIHDTIPCREKMVPAKNYSNNGTGKGERILWSLIIVIVLGGILLYLQSRKKST